MTQDNWKEYNGSDEQIAELSNAPRNFLITYDDGKVVNWNKSILKTEYREAYLKGAVSYWIIPDDPLREMKIRQAETGQPVWVRYTEPFDLGIYIPVTECTTKPNWYIPNAEYSFTPFED